MRTRAAGDLSLPPQATPGAVASENPRLRLFLLACGLAALIVGTLAQVLATPHPDALATWLQTTFVPAAVLLLLVVNVRERLSLLALTCALLYFEAILTASLYTIGIAFAILLPMIGIGLIHPHLRGRAALAVYVGAAVASTLSVALAAWNVPTNPLDQPGLAVVGFGLLAAFALGLMWRAGERWMRALESAEREITARVEVELQLSRTADSLQTLLRSSPVATMAIDREGAVSVWNPAAERLFGWTEAEVRGRPPPAEITASDDAEGLSAAIDRTLAGDLVEGDRTRCRRKDGTELLVEIHAAPLRDEHGRPLGPIVQVTDVSERAALEAQLRQAQKMEAVGQLAGGIAHDINNTLTAVGGFAELIHDASPEDDVTAYAETIMTSVGRARQLTRQLLAFARRSVLQPQTIEVTRFVSSIEPIVQRLLGADIRVQVRHEIEAGSIRVDPGQLEQVIYNLAVNSRDAMPDGGTLTIATRRLTSAVTAEGGGSEIVLAVSDTGSGIPVELRDQVFEPFFTTKEQGKGTGLGLAMVYGFVTQSGGTVELRSEPGQGTTIEIRLPEVVQEAARNLPEAPEPTTGDETILLVEDDRAVGELARRVLTAAGYRVLLAEDGRRAIELAAALDRPIELVLTDVIMPGMRGPEVARAVLEIHPEAGILYASGYSADAIAERGILPDGVEMIEKPYTSAELAQRVRTILDRRATRADQGQQR